ncbi:MAG: YchJ family protein [Leucobacter sp.]
MTNANPERTELCPCGLGNPYPECCGRFHEGAVAPTATQLMRSRYSAFAMRRDDYLLRTWHVSTRPTTLELDPEIRWLRLLIDESSTGGPFDETGTVTFTAIGRGPDGRFEQHERSRFVRESGQWFYVDGE